MTLPEVLVETVATKVHFAHREVAENGDAILTIESGVRNLDVADSFFPS